MLQQFLDFMTKNSINCMVWTFNECPLEEKWSLTHGGDEDYVVLGLNNMASTHIVDRITICDNNTSEGIVHAHSTGVSYYYLSVTAHA